MYTFVVLLMCMHLTCTVRVCWRSQTVHMLHKIMTTIMISKIVFADWLLVADCVPVNQIPLVVHVTLTQLTAFVVLLAVNVCMCVPISQTLHLLCIKLHHNTVSYLVADYAEVIIESLSLHVYALSSFSSVTSSCEWSAIYLIGPSDNNFTGLHAS